MGSQDEQNTGSESRGSSGRRPPPLPRPKTDSFDVDRQCDDLLAKMQLGERTRIGHYELIKEIGRGGMGVVYVARDHNLDRQVAIKRFQSRGNLELREHLMHEARAMAQLSHPNVVPVYEIRDQDDMTFIVMEYVDGVTLNEWLREATRSMEDILAVFLAAGAGLAAAHSHKLVHRDFKPANVMRGFDGRVRVMDFGLACPDPGKDSTLRVGSRDTQRDSTESTIAGTPAYMAPEHFRGRWADARSDQFSFCVALYEALYGQRPFAGSNREQVWAAAERGEISPELPHTTVPTWLRQVVVRGLAPDPRDRFESMEALLDALAPKHGELVNSFPSLPPPSSAARAQPRRRIAIYGAVVGLLAMTAAVTLVVQPYMFPAVLDIEACVVRIEGGNTISRAWVVLEDGGEYEVEVAGKILRFRCVEQNQLATVIAQFEDGDVKYWSSVELTGDNTLRVSDAKPGRPADLSPELQRSLDEISARTQEEAVGAPKQGAHDESVPGCTIGGAHKAAGALDPANACQVCAPETNATGWSHLTAGTSCGTGKVCDEGECGAACFIGGVLHDTNAANPTNPCQTCQPNESTTEWTNAADGTSCGNGQTCVNASCGTQCVINGQVYASGAENPANACQRCQPGTSTTSWTTNHPADLGESCGSCGGKVQCDGTCSVETPASFGLSCNSCGGTFQCNGACSTKEPTTLGESCNSCGGIMQCNGTCSTTEPPNLNQSCGSCGGTVQCDGSCSFPTPGNFGMKCNSCGGTVKCDGSCSTSQPANFGAACNSCGGTVQCDGSCSTSQPGNFGAACNSCGGTVQCNGTCWPEQPGNFGSVQVRSKDLEEFWCCGLDYQKNFGGACSSGWVYDRVEVDKVTGGGACFVTAAPPSGGSSCQVTMRFHNNGLEGARCNVTIFERRGC
jgi:serine/threonine protein kinase